MRCDKNLIMSQDEVACTGKLGKEPPKPKFDGFVIGDDLAQRLRTGAVDETRNATYDNYWAEKVLCMDHNHTNRYKLTIADAEMSIDNIQHYLEVTAPKNAKIAVEQLTSCIEAYKGRGLSCSSDVQDFINAVDKLAFKAVRSSSKNSKSKKNTTYAERFHHTY